MMQFLKKLFNGQGNNKPENTDKYKQVLEQAPGAVYIIDNKMNFEYINPYFTKLSGYSREELLGKNLKDTLYKGKIPESRLPIMDTLNKGLRWEGELLTYKKNGESYWAKTIAAPYCDSYNKICGTIIIQQDITHQKEMELALNESENLYRNLIENSLEGVAITQDANILLFNKAFYTMFGYTANEMRTKTPVDLISADDRDRVFEMHYKRMRGEIQNAVYKAKFVKKDGSIFIAEMNASTVQIKGHNASFVTMRDITDREKLQNELEQSVQRFRDLAEMLPQTVYELDMEGRQTYMNKAGLNAFRHTYNAIGHLALDSIAPEDHERMRINMKKSLQKDKDYTIGNEYTAVRQDGTRFPIMVYAAPIIIKDEVVGTRGIIIDISERKAMENAIRESELKYKTLVENSLEGISIIRDNRYLFVNQTYCNMLGYTANELYEMPSHISIHPDDRDKALKIGERRRNRDFTTINEVIKLLTKSGEVRECETTSTMIEYNGQWASFFTSHDITENKRMQEALSESEKKYRELVETTNSIILKWDQNFNITFLNEYGLNFFGYQSDEIIGKSIIGTILPTTESQTQRDLTNLMEEVMKDPAKYAQNTNQNMRKNGELVWISWFNTPIKNENGEILGLKSIGIDVTQSRQMQLELKESEEKYRQLFKAESDAIFMIDSETGQILDANPAASRIYGYTHEEFLTMKNTDVSAEPDKTKTATIEKVEFVPIRKHRKKDGTILSVELSAGFTSLKDKKVQIITSRDITERLQIQEVLRESEKKYRELAELLPQSVFELDARGNLTYMNRTACEIFGIDESDINTPATRFIAPEYHQVMTEKMEKTVTLGIATYGSTYTALRKNGTTFPAMTFATPIYENGKITGIRGIMLDMTEHEAMQNALRESEKKYRELADFMPQTIYELDEKGNLLYVNKSGMDVFGLSEADYGTSCFKSFIPENAEALIQNVGKLMEGRSSELVFEYTGRSSDGREFPVITYSLPIYKDGKVAGIRGMAIDISERKAIENALRESEEKYRTLIEKATDGIIITQNGYIQFANPAMSEMLKYSTEEFVGQPYMKFAAPEDHQTMMDFHKRRMQGEYFTSVYRSRLLQKDGNLITAELNARTFDYNGAPAAFIIIRNISDRLQIENELKFAKDELERLNHDLEARVIESSKKLAETNTQLINLQKENLQSQFEVLRQQVNPHFLFNSLNVLTSLIKLEPDLAEKFSEHLSKVYRYVLENKDNEWVDLHTELRFLDAYIFLLNIRFVDKIQVRIDIPDHKKSHLIIPLAMQLLIENAIKHNIMTKAEPLKIDIFIDNDNYLNVVNNLQERPSQLISTGVGLKNIQNRYLLLNNTVPVFTKTDTHFIAKVPLVSTEN